MQELRGLERFNMGLPSRIVLATSGRDDALDLMTENISSGGAFFHTSDPLLAGTEVRIDLILPLDKLKKLKGKRACIRVNGKVLRKGSEGMAIGFNRHYKIIPMEGT